MKYTEIIERLRLLFPKTGDGMIKSLWNKYSRLFQHETHYDIINKKTILLATFASGNSASVDIIQLEGVTELVNGVEQSIGYLRATLADATTARISASGVKVYIFDNGKIYLYKTNTGG